MEEKYIINDVLETIKHNLIECENEIVSTSDMELRQTFQEIRNSEESLLYDMNKLAETKGYSLSVENANEDQIRKLNLLFRI